MKSAEQKNKHTNALINEKSPYLLQHAHNPVNWQPWGQTAFDQARHEGKPIFLSIGYSTCHWCHVMEHESFESEEMADILNKHFISVKVDREERPDVDQLYMTFVQSTTGHGGWPMSVWLTPDLKPFYGGTYFPPDDRYGRFGFKSLLLRIHDLWKTDRERILGQSDQILQMLIQETEAELGDKNVLTSEVAQRGYESFKRGFDSFEGGFSSAPKFPRPSTLQFLFRYAFQVGLDSERGKDALHMALFTLDKMNDGGMHDHIGGGFHRYSVDEYWHVPHYEKMLYDQAQLAFSYLEAYQITKHDKYAHVVRDILTYVSRDMTNSQGAFFSAEDADSLPEKGADHKTEGAFYVWEYHEIQALLDDESEGLFIDHFGVKKNGNSPPGSDPHDKLINKNTLIRRTILKNDEEKQKIAAAKQLIFEARNKRPHPHLDDKIITAWNGLMISAYARAALTLNEMTYLTAATQAAEFIRKNLYDASDNLLYRNFREERSMTRGFATDYAYLIQGLLDLYSASAESQWLSWALQLQEKQDQLFRDEKTGAYYTSSGKDPSILIRMTDSYDGAEPSPASVTVANLLRFYDITGDSEFLNHAEQTAASVAEVLRNSPTAVPEMLASIAWMISEQKTQIFIAGDMDTEAAHKLRSSLLAEYNPFKVLIYPTEAAEVKIASAYQELGKQHSTQSPKAYICKNFACQMVE
ncbi:MAG: thioredoxin domain-containing protein [Verrucomicrobiota bacterium]